MGIKEVNNQSTVVGNGVANLPGFLSASVGSMYFVNKTYVNCK